MMFGGANVWAPPVLRPAPVIGGPRPAATWWDQYSNQLTLPTQVITEINSASTQIVGNLNPTVHNGGGRLSVVGAVQSGKTASMIGVVAKAMDQGFNIIVVLSGSKNTLRNQTALRFNKELLGLSEGIQDTANSPFIWTDTAPPAAATPVSILGVRKYVKYLKPGMRHGCEVLPFHRDVTGANIHMNRIAAELERGNIAHIVLVIKKQAHNIRQMMDGLHLEFAGKKSDYSMLIIDDESDEVTCPPSSMVNTGVLRPLAMHGFELSQGIVSPGDPGDHFLTHTVEYTATPQAPHAHPQVVNFAPNAGQLNPFHSYRVHVLRTPADNASHPAINYPSTPDYDGWYTGGSFFYDHDPSTSPPAQPRGMNAKHPPSTPPPLQLPMLNSASLAFSNPLDAKPPLFPYDEAIGDMASSKGLKNALLGYLVSGAIRLAQQPGKTLIGGADWPKPHSMLLHTDRGKVAHWNLGYEIAGLLENFGAPHPTVIRENSPIGSLNRANIHTWLTACSAEINEWFDYYENRYDDITSDGANRNTFPTFPDFEIKLSEVVDHLKIKVINSDKDASKLKWDVTRTATGVPIKPDDIYTIVIGGDILARGLTIPNLATTWFTRDSRKPLEDSVIQRQRWFGYRGNMWEFVTLHAPEYLLNELKNMHLADEQARLHMHRYQLSGQSPAASVFRVTLPRYRGSGKIGAPFEPAPNASTFFQKVQFECNGSAQAQNNENIAGDIIREINTSPQATFSGLSGIVNITNKKSALEIANYLDRIQFSDHGPNPDPSIRSIRAYKFFDAAQNHFSPGGTLLKPPVTGGPAASISSWNQDPYLVAAYLRFWHYLHTNPGELAKLVGAGLISGNGGGTPTAPPEFNLVLSGGSLNSVTGYSDADVNAPNPTFVPNPISEAGVNVSDQKAISTWMGHNPARSPGGNRFLDIPVHSVNGLGHYTDARPSAWNGMFMINIMETNGPNTAKITNLPTGLTHANIAPNFAPIEFAISIPEGGPVLSFIGA